MAFVIEMAGTKPGHDTERPDTERPDTERPVSVALNSPTRKTVTAAGPTARSRSDRARCRGPSSRAPPRPGPPDSPPASGRRRRSEAERRIVDNFLHDEECSSLPDAWQRYQRLAMQSVEIDHVPHTDFEEVVELAVPGDLDVAVWPEFLLDYVFNAVQIGELSDAVSHALGGQK